MPACVMSRKHDVFCIVASRAGTDIAQVAHSRCAIGEARLRTPLELGRTRTCSRHSKRRAGKLVRTRALSSPLLPPRQRLLRARRHRAEPFPCERDHTEKPGYKAVSTKPALRT